MEFTQGEFLLVDIAPAVSAVEPSPAEAVVTVAPTVDPPVSVATVQESPSVVIGI